MKNLTALLIWLMLATTATADVTRIEVPGGHYGENRLDRQYAVLVTNQYVQTAAGRIPLPTYIADGREVADNVLFVRVTPTGEFKIAGQSHSGLGTWEWSNGTWRIVATSYGVNPVIYDWAGGLHLGALQFGSQGFRYATHTNELITGDATYADPSRAIWEYSTYGDVTIGQGASGCISIHGMDRRMLERGDCRFVRFIRTANFLAMYFVKQLEGKSVMMWMNVDDLASFPPELPPIVVPPVVVVPPVIVPPVVTPQMPRFPDDVYATLVQVRDEYPKDRDLTDEEIGAILNKTAWIHKDKGIGMQAKPGGTSSIQPRTGIRVWNGLRFMYNGQHYGADVCGACSIHRFNPVQAEGGPAEASSFVPPVQPEGVVVPGPGTDPVPTDPKLSERIASLERDLAAVRAEAFTEKLKVFALAERVEELEGKTSSGGGVQEQRVMDIIKDFFSRAVVEGSTGRGSWGHTHPVNLGVTVK